MTDTREKAIRLSTEGDGLRRHATDLKDYVDALSDRTRGPLNNVMTIGRMLANSDDPDDKAALLSVLEATVESALGELDTQDLDGTRLLDARTMAPVDLANICRTLAGLVDPSGALEISHPELDILAEDVPLQVILHQMLDVAAASAETHIDILIRPKIPPGRSLVLSIDFDTRTGCSPDVCQVRALAEDHGWEFGMRGGGTLFGMDLIFDGRIPGEH